jgi:hypothetical protein
MSPLRKKIFIYCCLVFLSHMSLGQTNPTPFDMSGGTNYSFTAQTATSTTYPVNMKGWLTTTNNLTAAELLPGSGDIALVANGTITSATISNLGTNGFQFLNTGAGASRKTGSLCLALNTTNRQSISVTWTAQDMQPNANYTEMGLAFQYRVGTTGNFTGLGGTVLYRTLASGQQGAQTFANIVLPAACNNQPIVHIRWFYYTIGAVGSNGREPIRLDDISVTSVPLPSCSGVPNPGNTVASSTSVAAGGTTNLSLQNSISGLGVTYQWQSSPNNTSWTSIAGATNPTYTATINAPVTYFRCVVVCTASGQTTNATPILVNGLYCSSTFSNTTYYINAFSTTGGSVNINNATNGISASGYGSFTNQNVTIPPGETVNFNAALASPSASSTYGFSVYVDWNNNLDFTDAGERVYTTAGYRTSPISGSFSVPVGQAVGTYRMRVVADYLATTPASCNNRSDGETEDYSLVVPPLTPCSGLPYPGIPSVSPSSGTAGSTASLSASSVSYNSGLTYQWQVSTDGGVTWTNIVGATTLPYAVTIPNQPVNSTVQYRLGVTCGAQTAYSTHTSFSIGAYCVPTITNAANSFMTKVSFLGTLQDVTNTSTYSTSPVGYQNFMNLPLLPKQAQGAGINVYVQSPNTSYMRAWVDWNNNAVFDDSELVYSSETYLAYSTTFGFVIPAGQTPGRYRFRIRTTNAVIGANPSCEAYSNGETEDYLFQVVASCNANITGVNNVLVCGSGTPTLNVTATATTTQYNWYATQNATTPVATTTLPSWTTPPIVRTEIYYVTAANNQCESVEKTPIRVVFSTLPEISFLPSNNPTICGDGVSLELSATADNEQAFLINQPFESGLGVFAVSNIIDNGATINSQSQWQIQSSAFVPTNTAVWRPAVSSGLTGNKFLFATSDFAGMNINTAITSSRLSTENFTDLFLDFSVYYSHYLDDNVTTQADSLLIEVSTNGGSSWTRVAYYIEDQGIGTRFIDNSINLSAYTGFADFRIRFRYRSYWADGAALDDIKLYGTRPLSTSYNWAPLTYNNLFLDDDGSTPYTGGSVTEIYIIPTTSQLDTGAVFVYTATATLSNGCFAEAPVTVTISANQWTGSAGPDWHNPANWCSGLVPTANTRVEIPSTSVNFPVISASANARSIKIFPGALLTIQSSGNLNVKTFFDNQGTLANHGRIELSGTTAQSFPGAGTINVMNVLHINNTGPGVTINKSFVIQKELRPTAGALHLDNFDITLRSNASGTAWVSKLGPNASFSYGTGRFVVERYIPTGIAHGKSWQFLSVPTNGGQTIQQAWQEGATVPNQNPLPGYGTQITGQMANATSLGFDVYSPTGPSMKVLSAIGTWVGVSSTNATPLYNSKGYMIFVRGDRSSSTFTAPSVPTILRNRGKLFDQTANTPPVITVMPGKLESVGNPYAAPIDFANPDGLLFDGPPYIENMYYVWDPTLTGSQGLGGYQTMSAAVDFAPSPGGTLNYPAGVSNSIIQSGQAFLMKGGPAGGTVEFTEDAKVDSTRMVFRAANRQRTSRVNISGNKKILWTRLLVSNNGIQTVADGNAISIHPLFSNTVGDFDAIKLGNPGENFSILHGVDKLSIDARASVQVGDTIHFTMSNMRLMNYKLRFTPQDVSDLSVIPVLVDRYVHSETMLSWTQPVEYAFAVHADPNSYQANRFYIVFRPAQTLPVSFLSVDARRKTNQSATISWRVAQEHQLLGYVVERSTDGRSFEAIGELAVGVGNAYAYLDMNAPVSDVHYRIRTKELNGTSLISRIVTLYAVTESPSVRVLSNPVTNGLIQLQTNRLPVGQYQLAIVDQQGKTIWRKAQPITADQLIAIDCSGWASGVYSLNCTDLIGTRFQCSINIITAIK